MYHIGFFREMDPIRYVTLSMSIEEEEQEDSTADVSGPPSNPHKVCQNLHNRMESILMRHKEKYAAGSRLSIADFVLAAYVRNHLLNPASPVSATLQALLD